MSFKQNSLIFDNGTCERLIAFLAKLGIFAMLVLSFNVQGADIENSIKPQSASIAIAGIAPHTADLLFNASMKQAEYAFHSFETRRQFEWQVTISFWTALLVAVKFLSEKSQKFSPWIGLLVVAAHAWWERGVWVANNNDKRIADFFRRYAYDVFVNPSALPPSLFPPRLTANDISYWIGWLEDWAHLFQWGITVAIVIGAFFYLGMRQHGNQNNQSAAQHNVQGGRRKKRAAH